jgi:hypothetical protein
MTVCVVCLSPVPVVHVTPVYMCVCLLSRLYALHRCTCVFVYCPGCTRYTGVHVCFSTVPGVHVVPVYRRVLFVGYVVVPVHAYTCQHDYTLCDMLYVMCVYILYT